MKSNNSHSKLTLNKTLAIIGILIGMFVIGVIFYYVGIFIWTFVIKTPNNYSIENMKKWEPLEIRMNYFKEHEKSFRNIALIMENYPDIISIKISWKNNCVIGETEVKAGNTTFCVKEDSKQTNEIAKIDIDKEIEDLSEIVEIKKRDDYIEETNEFEYIGISFYLVTSFRAGHVKYNYCLNMNECTTDNDSYVFSSGKYEKTRIDDKWASIYNE